MRQALSIAKVKRVGIHGDTATNFQCLKVLADGGFNALFSSDDGQCKVTLLDPVGQPRKHALGPSYHVALRRLFTGVTGEELKGDERFTENV